MDATAPTDAAPLRTRLVLKDGTFQLVLSYKVDGDVVRYRSAERNGAVEEIPLAMVDLPATERWKREHTPGVAPQERAVLSPELAKEEAERAARTPEVAPNLRLPEDLSFLALDTYKAVPELVPLSQQGSDLNHETAHETVKLAINPSAAAHRIGDIAGYKADVQLHVALPVFYVRVGKDDEENTHGGALVVNTYGASGRATPGGGGIENDYVIERLDVRQGSRQIDSFRLQQLGTGKPQPDVIEVKSELLPGNHWLKLTPVEPLLFGEYALVEIVSDHEVNLDVWDFGVHPDAKENVEALRPEVKRAPALERR